jgi:hypothetical protein
LKDGSSACAVYEGQLAQVHRDRPVMTVSLGERANDQIDAGHVEFTDEAKLTV